MDGLVWVGSRPSSVICQHISGWMQTDCHGRAPSVAVLCAESSGGCCNMCLSVCLKLSPIFLQCFLMFFPILKLELGRDCVDLSTTDSCC